MLSLEMRRVFRNGVFMAVAVLLVVSCRREEKTQIIDGEGILRIVPQVHSSLSSSQGVATRVQIPSASKSLFVDGDAIGLYVTRSEDSLILGSNVMKEFDYSNLLYTRTGGAFTTNVGSPVGTIYYPYRGVNVDLWGIYPYDADAKTKNSALYPWSVLVEQNSESAVLASDFMVSRVSGVAPSENTPVAMEFEHRTSRIYMRVEVPLEIDGKKLKMDDPVSEIFIEGMTNEGLHDFNLDRFGSDLAGEVVVMTPLARGQQNVDDNDLDQGIYLYYELLAVPQTVRSGAQFVRLIVNYQSGDKGLFTLDASADVVLLQGKQHLFEIGFDNNQRLRLDGTKILDWDEASHVNSDLDESETIRVGNVDWATGNLVADGANGCKIGAPGDGGLYFQYGGLVGYKGGANGDGTGITNATTHLNGKWWSGAAAYSTNDVAVTPSIYANKATWPYFNNVAVGGFGYYYFNTFVTKYADFQAQANANNPTLGIGDPCTYYLGSPWRLPKYDELSAITGSSTEGSWVPWSTAGVTGKWSNSGPQSTMGAWFGSNSRSGTPTTNTDLFIPASGYRGYNDGAFYLVGTGGYLWSSSVYDYYRGFYLDIHESYGVIPRGAYNRAHAFPVRCVKDATTKPNPPTPDQIVTINGLKWTKGNLVADGANGCKVGAPGDAGLYFQYGGLIGYKGGATGDGTGITNATTHPNGKWWGGAAAYSANDVAVAPATYATKAAWPYFDNVAAGGFGYYYFNTFVTKYMDFQTQANALNVLLGIGDPCAHYIGNGWRLPKYNELSAITGNSTEGSWVPWSTAGVTGKWSNSGPQSTMGAWFGPNSRSGTPTTDTDLFIPASGYRYYNDGAFRNVGIEGLLWSSSVCDYRDGFGLSIHESNGVIPRLALSRARAFPVRCVQDVPTKPNPPTPDQIVTINGLKWTKGNLVADDGANCKVGAPGDGGLYFQYGGLVGYKGGANGDGRGITNATTHSDGKWWGGAAAYSANDVAVAPATYATKATWPYFDNVAVGGFGYYYFNTFVTKYADFQAQANANNPTLGIGDPCTYYLGSPWRLPKYDELSAITGSFIEEIWVPWSTAGVTGKWSNSGPQSTMGAWFGPNSRSGTPTTDTDLFIPASGHRNVSNGAFRWVGIDGLLWSSSVYDHRRGFYLAIGESAGVYPRGVNYRAHAFPVRCVQDIPTEPNPPTPDQIVTINGLKWTKGNLVADGANGCKVGAPGDGGLYFQYGGLVGYKGGANGDGRGITNATTHSNGKWWGGVTRYSDNDVAVTPSTYANKATWPYFSSIASGGFGYYYFSTFATKYADFQAEANANNPTLGIGDPCAYYLGNGWRLPKYNELSAITGNSSESWVKWTVANVTGKWSNSGPQSAKGAWFGPNSRLGTPATDTDLFIPASGYRHTSNNGAFSDVGTNGYLWSSSIYDSSLGFQLSIHESYGVAPRNLDDRAYGYPVRCVLN